MKIHRIGLIALIPALMCSFQAKATFIAPQLMPAERVIRNINAHLEQQPNDAEAYYALARVNYLCFANQILGVPTSQKRNGYPNIPPDWAIHTETLALQWEATKHLLGDQQATSSTEEIHSEAFQDKFWKFTQELENQKWQAPPLQSDQAVQFAAEGLKAFKQAIRLSPKNGLYLLGQASLERQFLEYKQKTTATLNLAPYPELAAIDMGYVTDDFYRAFELSIEDDMAIKIIGTGGLRSIVSHEAGQSFLNLAAKISNLSGQDKQRISLVRKKLEDFANTQPPRSETITPIIFSLKPDDKLVELLALKQSVVFDLDGDGAAERWPWLRPTTGILVWDPDKTGKITSGRQLFGSATWWMFFSNGYRALDALDDDRDGRLQGRELRGIAVWFDRNSDGISQPGEVVSLASLGIESIATAATVRDDILTNPKGITLRNGRMLATYDWIATPQR